MEDLKPCPFCGNKVTLGGSPEYYTQVFYQVECECGAVAGCAYIERGDAVSNWNRRDSTFNDVITELGKAE